MKHSDPIEGTLKIQDKKNMMFAGTTVANGPPRPGRFPPALASSLLLSAPTAVIE